jgi:hypothetical protein
MRSARSTMALQYNKAWFQVRMTYVEAGVRSSSLGSRFSSTMPQTSAQDFVVQRVVGGTPHVGTQGFFIDLQQRAR